jgi:hypothetical protein
VDECKPLATGMGMAMMDFVVRECRAVVPHGRGLHSFTVELNLSNSRTRSLAKSSYTVDRRADVELNWERV